MKLRSGCCRLSRQAKSVPYVKGVYLFPYLFCLWLLILWLLIMVNRACFAQEKLNIDDIQQFSEKTSTISQSTEELYNKAQDIANHQTEQIGPVSPKFQPMGNLCKNREELVRKSLATFSPYFNLFQKYALTDSWSVQIKKSIEDIILSLEDPQTARLHIKELQVQLCYLEQLKNELIRNGQISNSQKSSALSPKKDVSFQDYDRIISQVAVDLQLPNNNKQKSSDISQLSEIKKESLFTTRYKLANQLEIIDSFRYTMDRHIYMWTLVLSWYEVCNANHLILPRNLSSDDIRYLQKATESVRNYFGVSDIGKAWRQGFEIDLLLNELQYIHQLQTTAPVFVPVSGNGTNRQISGESRKKMLDERLHFLYERINSISFKTQFTPMTTDQKALFQKEPLLGWCRSLKKYTYDISNPIDLLYAFEIYEKSGGSQAGERLFQLAWNMKCSRSEVCRRLGEAIDVIYNNPNTKVYISEVLINRLLPIRDPEFDVVQETVLDNPVAGQRRTDTQVLMELVPSPDRLLMNLLIQGRIIASTSSSFFPATVYNQSYATYMGRKTLEWRKYGIVSNPTDVQVNNSNELRDVQTDVDFVPLIGDLLRGVAKGQYELKQADIERETKSKIVQQVRYRVDREVNERFDVVNERMKDRFFGHLERLGLDLNIQKARTTEDWLLASLRLQSGRSLGSQMVEPPTMPGAFADLKLHESTINIFLSRMELSGKSYNIPQLLHHIGEKIQTPSFMANTEVNQDLLLTFAQEDPITVRFMEDRIKLVFQFDSIELKNQTWSDITVTISYRPEENEEGRSQLVRDGLIELEGPLSIRAQIPLRAIFAKIFPSEKTIGLEPPLFRTDERFAGLTTGLCRVSRGWFAISIVRPTNIILYRYQ